MKQLLPPFSNLRFFVISLILGCSLIWCSTSMAEPRTVEELTGLGKDALGAGRYEEALEYFVTARNQNADEEAELRLLFYSAVTLQQYAENAPEPRKERALEQSARLYTIYLESRPDTSTVVNNLAKVYEQLGWPDQAMELYEKAIAQSDSRQGLYLTNYAELLDNLEKWDDATQVYTRLVQEQPLSHSQQISLAARYAERGLNELAGYVWQLIDAGGSWQVADLALSALAESKEQDARSRQELITAVSVALSRMNPESERYAELGFDQRLRALGDDSQIGEGASEIVMLKVVIRRALAMARNSELDLERFEALRQRLEPEHYHWWGQRVRPDMEPKRGVWPADGFRDLIRSFGVRAQQVANLVSSDKRKASEYYRLAESYFQLAADLQMAEVDPAAVRNLVRLKVETDKLPEVKDVLEKYEGRLFEGKGGAIRRNQLKKTFEYHKTLGDLYTQMDRWGDSSSAQSAIFQLEHARDKSHQIEDQSGGALPEAYRFTPDMVDMLDAAYQANDESIKGERLRIEEAERYQMQGETEAVREVLEPLNNKQLQDVDLQTRRDEITAFSSPEETPSRLDDRVIDRSSLQIDESVGIRLTESENLPLSKEQVKGIEEQLRRALDPTVANPSPDELQSAPGTIKSIQLQSQGRGKLDLEVEGQIMEIPFEKYSEMERIEQPDGER